MDPAPLASLLFIAFVAGLGRGSVVCLSMCGPALVSYVACETGGGWRGGLLTAVRFNGVRVLIMTVFGAVVGYLTGTAISLWLRDVISNLYFVGYFLLGLYVIFLGISLYRRTGCGPAGRLIHRLQGVLVSERGVALSLGTILGFACIIEIIALEGTVIGAAAGLFGATYGGSTALMGAAAMLSFGIGSSLPITIATSGAGGLSGRVRSSQQIRKVTSIALIVVGIVMTLSKLPPLLAMAGFMG